MSNYPDGVSDAHPYFNPQEGSVHVVCGNDTATVVPAHAITKALEKLRKMAGGDYKGDGGLNRPANHGTIVEHIDMMQELVELSEKEADYECPFEGVMDVDISEEAEWVCPLCGVTRVSDTTPEDRDPDEGWDNRHDD